jgi:hypothetical protein
MGALGLFPEPSGLLQAPSRPAEAMVAALSSAATRARELVVIEVSPQRDYVALIISMIDPSSPDFN